MGETRGRRIDSTRGGKLSLFFVSPFSLPRCIMIISSFFGFQGERFQEERERKIKNRREREAIRNGFVLDQKTSSS